MIKLENEIEKKAKKITDFEKFSTEILKPLDFNELIDKDIARAVKKDVVEVQRERDFVAEARQRSGFQIKTEQKPKFYTTDTFGRHFDIKTGKLIENLSDFEQPGTETENRGLEEQLDAKANVEKTKKERNVKNRSVDEDEDDKEEADKQNDMSVQKLKYQHSDYLNAITYALNRKLDTLRNIYGVNSRNDMFVSNNEKQWEYLGQPKLKLDFTEKKVKIIQDLIDLLHDPKKMDAITYLIQLSDV